MIFTILGVISSKLRNMNKRREIIADIDKYFIQEHLETNQLFGIPKEEFDSKISPLEKDYEFDSTKFPDFIRVKCHPLIKQGNENKYKINLEREIEVEYNKLKPIWVEVRK
jgi:hypothetical protein